MLVSFIVATSVVTALVSLVFAILLVARRPVPSANRFLAGFLVVVAWQTGTVATEPTFWWSALARLSAGAGMLMGPLLFLHARQLLWPETRARRGDLVHGLPALVLCLAYSPGTTVLQGLAVQSSIAGYLGWILASATRCDKEGDESFALRRTWVGDVVIAGAASLLAAVVCFWVLQGNATQYYGVASVVTTLAMAALVGRIVAEGVRHPTLFLAVGASASRALALDGDAGARAAASDRRVQRVVDALAREQLYADPGLTAERLAEYVRLAPRTLSRVVNAELGRSIPELVNQYRVQEAMRILADRDRDDERIIDVLYAVGFNSKSSFNAAFRRHTGITPSEYRRRRD